MKPRWLKVLALAVVVIAGPARAWMIAHSNNQLNPAVSPELYRPAPDGSRPVPGLAPAPAHLELLPLDPRLDPRVPEAVERAILKWNLPGSSLAVTAGRVNKEAGTGWQSRYNQADGRNTIEFITAGWPAFWGPNVVAMTIPKTDGTGRILESDVFCNAQDFFWTVIPEAGADPSAPPGDRVVDLENVITHEVGHVLGLGHSQHPWAAMHPYPGIRSTRARHLTADDRAALRYLYPATAEDVPPADLWGFAPENFSDGACGSSYHSLLSATISYVERVSPLPGPHDLVRPSSPPSPYHFCLLGSGFRPEPAGAGLLAGATVAADALGPEILGTNFARGSLDDGSSVFPPLPTGVYDFFVHQAWGGTAALPQGVFVIDAGNELPEAVLVAGALAPTGRTVRLDASGSFDPEAATLSYRYRLVDSPTPARISADGDQAVLELPAPGVYVVELIVNDGTIDSIADFAVIQAVRFPRGGSTRSAFGCVAVPGRSSPFALVVLLAPLAALGVSRVARRSRGKGAPAH